MIHDRRVVHHSGQRRARTDSGSREWLVGGGELGEMIRRADWLRTPFGPRHRWSQSLRTTVSLVVANSFPMVLLWTGDLLLLYNDAYRTVAGDKHPHALGRPLREVWPERWNINQPILAPVIDRGETACIENRQFPIKRVGSVQDAYFTFCCSPVRVEDGTVGGVLVTAQDTTLAVVRQRAEADRFLAALNDSRVSESRLRRIFESSPIDVALIGLDGRFLDVNKAALDLHGFCRKEELIGRDCLDLVAPEHHAKVADAWQHTLREGGVREVDLVQLRRDGRRINTLVSATRLDDADGRPYALLAMVQDVTEAKEAQEALRIRDERLRVATEATALGIYDFNPVTGEHQWDARTRDLWGLDADEEVTWESLVSGIHPDDRAAFQAANARALDPCGDGVYACQYRVRNRVDGIERWVSAIGHATFAEGRAARLVGTVQDITGHKQIEAALVESRERFTYAVTAAREGVWDWNMETNEVWYSPRYKEMLGYSEKEIEHHLSAWLRLVHPDDRQRSLDVVDAVMRGERDYEIEFRMRHKDGHYLDILSRGFPIGRQSDGRIVRIVGTHLDQTDRKRAEAALEDSRRRLQEANRRKDEFLAMLAHELRNPLAVIGNASLILQRGDQALPEAEGARNAIERQTRHMGRLIDDLLDVSRVTQGKIGLRPDRVDVADIVRDALDATRPFVQSHGHQMFLTLPRGPVALNVDPVRMTQAISNVLHNAAKYTPPGGRIHLSAECVGGAVEIRIRDNGIGIEAALLPHIFDLFVQGDRSPEREQGGLGIGLTMARSLVEAQGGTIVARSDGPGTGSEFIVLVPLAAATPRAPTAATPERSGQPARRRVLVVDDNADAREMMRLLIQMEGHDVAVYGDGPAAIAAALQDPPDVVLIDLGMPRMDGFEVARRMRAEPSLARTVLVALTGYGQEEDVQRSREAGCDSHITKSADFEPIRRVLASVAVVTGTA